MYNLNKLYKELSDLVRGVGNWHEREIVGKARIEGGFAFVDYVYYFVSKRETANGVHYHIAVDKKMIDVYRQRRQNDKLKRIEL